MNADEVRAILALCLHAAFADGNKDERERAQVKGIADSLGAEADIDFPRLYQDVLLKRVSVEQAVAALAQPEHRQLAFEMAVCVCDADGATSEAERAFLERLAAMLGVGTVQAQQTTAQAEAIAREAVPAPAVAASAYASTMSPEEMDSAILKASILNGALELLPQSVASMAIIPLQMRLVYRIGKSHGFELDSGHIKDFLATMGVGLTSQYLEQMGRKLIGGLLRKVGGKLAGGIGSAATGVAFSFATTYALGHVARRYYAGGRTLDGAALKVAFEDVFGKARALQAQYQPQIEQQARTLSPSRIMDLVRQS